MSIEFLDCLKRERDISMKAMSSGGKMAFRLIPPLRTSNFEAERSYYFWQFEPEKFLRCSYGPRLRLGAQTCKKRT